MKPYRDNATPFMTRLFIIAAVGILVALGLFAWATAQGAPNPHPTVISSPLPRVSVGVTR